MITIKNQRQFAKMAEAGKCVAAVHEAVVEAAEVGVQLKDLDELAGRVIRDHGCRPSFLGYQGFPAHTCMSPNEVVVHGIPGPYRLAEGDLLSIDAGAIYNGYHADAALTVPIGEVDEESARLIEITRQALWSGIDQTLAGNRVGDIGHAVETEAAPHGYGVVTDYVGHGHLCGADVQPGDGRDTDQTGWLDGGNRGRKEIRPFRTYRGADKRRAGGPHFKRLAHSPPVGVVLWVRPVLSRPF